MSHKIRPDETPPFVHKIFLNSNNRRVKKKPPKLYPDRKKTSDCVKNFSSKISTIEEIVTLNNVPCEVEYRFIKITLENLHN